MSRLIGQYLKETREFSAAVLACNAEDRWKEAVSRKHCVVTMKRSSAKGRKEYDVEYQPLTSFS